MELVEIKLPKDELLYRSNFQYSTDEDGEGVTIEVMYTSPHFSDDLTTQLVGGTRTYSANYVKTLTDTFFIHSGDLLLDN